MLNFKEYILLLNEANTKSQVKNKIIGNYSNVIKHIIKVVDINDSTNLNKHLSEMKGWLEYINNYSNNSKSKISEDEYFKWLYVNHNIKNYVKEIERSYEVKIDLELINQVNENIARYLSEVFANKEFIDFKEVKLMMGVNE